jgi:hypothetical protein
MIASAPSLVTLNKYNDLADKTIVVQYLQLNGRERQPFVLHVILQELPGRYLQATELVMSALAALVSESTDWGWLLSTGTEQGTLKFISS